jgi:hypothetical protein
MKRMILSLLALGFVAMGVVGCHASATVDPHGVAPINVAK